MLGRGLEQTLTIVFCASYDAYVLERSVCVGPESVRAGEPALILRVQMDVRVLSDLQTNVGN